MRRGRVEDQWTWGDTFIAAAMGCIGAFALFLFVSSAHGQSAVDPTLPVASSNLESSPVRTNFVSTYNDLNNLFNRFPGSTAVNSIPVWSTTAGAFRDDGTAFLSTSGGGVPFFQVLGATVLSGYTNTSATFPVLILDPGGAGTADSLSIRKNGTPLWRWTAAGALITDLSGTNKFDVGTTGNIDIEGSGLAGDVIDINCTSLIQDCLDIDEDGTQRLKLEAGGAFKITATTAVPLTATQATVGQPVRQYVTTTTGDDPTETRLHGRAATTDATQTTIATVATASDTVIQVEVNIVARVTGGAGGNAGAGASYKLIEGFKNVAGTVTRLEGSAATALEAAESAALSAYEAQINISTTNIIVQVTGAATDNVSWHAFVTYSAVGS